LLWHWLSNPCVVKAVSATRELNRLSGHHFPGHPTPQLSEDRLALAYIRLRLKELKTATNLLGFDCALTTLLLTLRFSQSLDL
jgi:hypothetical protein